MKRSPGAGRLTAALAVLPLCVWLAGLYSASRVDEPGPEEARALLEARAAEVGLAFRSMRDEAGRVAELARDRDPAAAARQAAARGPLGRRVEGIGLLDGAGRMVEWVGTPEDPPPAPGARIGVDGLRTRLMVRSAPDRQGRSGTATLLLDGDTRELAFIALLPRSRARATVQDVHFFSRVPDRASDLAVRPGERVFRPGPPHVLIAPIEDGGGEAVGWVRLQDVRAAHLAAERRAQALAAAAALLTLLAGGAALRHPPRAWRGLAGLLAVLAGCRALLIAAQATSRLLPRELGSPSLFGTTAAFGALASPADLALTCLCWWLAARALARLTRARIAQAAAALALSSAAALLSTAGLLAVSVSLGESARLDLLRLAPSGAWGPQALLLAGWVLALQATAELWALVWSALREARAGRLAWAPDRVATLLASLPLAAIATALLLSTQDRNAVERLRTEFAPQVLEQRARREGALLAAVAEAAASERALEALAATPAGEDPHAAYRLWVGGTLFRQGLQSSIDLYREDGTLVSHFGFDLPPLHEPPPRAVEGEPVAQREGDPWALGFRQSLLHAEMPVSRSGVRLGAVVAHVTDDPSNLPFLPSIAPYLAALGPGHPDGRGDVGGTPDYVLYDASGAIVLQTLDDPPAASRAMHAAAANGRTLALRVGDEPWTGLPLRDDAAPGQLHLLLLPARSALDYLGACVRLSLLSLVFLALRVVGAYGLDRGRWGAAWRTLRGSFYRKLLATLLLASVLPLVGLSLFLWTYIGARGRAALVEDATRLVRVVQKVIEDYASSGAGREPGEAGGPVLDDVILHWLGRMVGQEILVYRDGALLATSKRELFASGLLTPRLHGEVAAALTVRRMPYVVRTLALGATPIPVVYTRIRVPAGGASTVVAVPLVLQEQEAARAVEQVVEMLLLATVALGTLLAAAVSPLARSVARPVRLLVDATGRIAAGDYGERLSTRSRDELAGLVNGFNAMSAALAAQRADLERRRDYMEALLRHATTGVLSTDADGRVVTVNPAALHLLDGAGGPPRTGDMLVETVAREPELAPLGFALARRTAEGGEPVDVDLMRRGEARRLRLVRVDLPDPDGGPPGALVLIEDVTDLMRSNQLAAWAEMARAIAHEIKNPLTPIQLSTEHLERLLRDRGLLPSPEMESCLQTVTKQVRALREIASEFSAYSKLPDLAPRPTDPAEFLREVVAPYRAAHPPGISIEEDYVVAGAAAVDAKVLARAVVNLIENALQAMPHGGRLRVGVRRKDGEVVLSVSDTGPGLDPGVRARLFTPYFSTKSSGTGLGLAIVRRAVEAHGGHVEVASAPGHGTTFTIHLPAI